MKESTAGSSTSLSPAQQNVNSQVEFIMVGFIAKGAEIFDKFKTSIRQFDAKSAQIQDLATAIVQIKTNLKRKWIIVRTMNWLPSNRNDRKSLLICK